MNVNSFLRAIGKAMAKSKSGGGGGKGNDRQILQNFLPSYWGPGGRLYQCRLVRIARSPVNGRTVAYYDHPNGRERFLYCVRSGVPTELKRYQKGR